MPPRPVPALPERGRFIPIGLKFALLSVFVVGIATALGFFQAAERERARMIESKSIAASMVADLLAQSLQAPLDFADEDAARTELHHLEQNRDVVYAGVWQRGGTLPMVELRAAHASFPLPSDLKTPRTVALADRVETVRTVLGRSGKPLGSALIQFSLARENAELAVARQNILLYCLLLAVGTMGLLILATRVQIVAPIQNLLDAARRVERGDSGASVDVHANDEIGRLARAFNAMNAAIFDRERRLATANRSLRELFDHMRQGILVFGADGKVTGAQSRAAEELFGSAELQGRDVRELLYGDYGHWDAERRAFDEWLPLAFDAPAESWSEIAQLAPQRVALHPGTPGERDVTLEFRPIAQQGRVARIMLLATDETDRRRLEREMERQGARHKSQLAVMRRLVAGGGYQFVGFLEHARRRFERASELLVSSGSRLAMGSIAELFQTTHTMRAEAQTFELSELARVLEGLEARLAELRGEAGEAGADLGRVHSDLEGALQSALSLIEQSKELFVEASPSGRAALDSVVVRRSDLNHLVELCAGRHDEIGRSVARLAARPFGECVASVIERASSWAEKENKRVRVEIDGRDAPVPPELAGVLGGVLAHLVRNAIAHGIEPVPERVSRGKPPVGSIELICQSAEADSAVLVVEDDGRGVADNELLARAMSARVPLGNLPHSSLSTRAEVSDLAGRGVGLAAVERDLARVGYSVSVAPRPGGGTRFEIRPRRGHAA